ncbi:MAG TPA: zinc-binding alcohol dehydrogenase family protein [Actinopolymorphaceae bacterium]|jgi:NADPH:quinone reductase-like Zn-dependent oxidoreductase
MKAAVIERFGEAPVLGDVAEPQADGGRVVARVRAAAIKNVERMLVAGTHYASARLTPPAPVGLDAVVELPDGRRMYAVVPPPGGAMAERMAVDPKQAVPVPEGVDDATAAAAPNAGISAWLALEYTGELRAGQSVLVLGATGVAGALAVQLAKKKFAAKQVVAVGRNVERLDSLTQLGADRSIALSTDPDEFTAQIAKLHAESPFDLVLDFLWGEPAERTLRVLSGNDLDADYQQTTFVQIGETAGPTISLPAAVLRSTGIRLVGQGGGSLPRDVYARVREILPELFDMIARGTLQIDTITRPLDGVAEAWNERVPSGSRMVLIP